MYGCDSYDMACYSSWNGWPNQTSWCEWCTDYANNGFQNFNPLGINWGDPDVMCDCCNNVVESYDYIINPDQISGVCVDPGDGTGFVS